MARQSQDREDLLRDATAFVDRMLLKVRINDQTSEVFVGFRAQGAASFYFDQDPVYHFNNSGKLRRAFVEGCLIKADAGQLASLQRQHSKDEVAMIRSDMTQDMQQQFCLAAAQQLNALRQALAAAEYVVEGLVIATDKSETADHNFVNRVIKYLKQLGTLTVADSPHVAG